MARSVGTTARDNAVFLGNLPFADTNFCVRIAAIILLLAGAARAGGNDLQLWRLGHPDPLPCTICDGSPGDFAEPGSPGAQARFHRMASTLGLAFAPPFQEPAATTGQAGFEVGLGSSQAFLHIGTESWPTVDTQMMAVSADVRWAVVEGLETAPDVALRVWGTRVIGAQDLDLTMAGADALVSRSFGVAGMMKVQPYGSVGLALIDVESAAVDFKPGVEDPARPGIDDQVFHRIKLLDNRFWRAGAGARLLVGSVVVGVEGAVAWGTNPVQEGPGVATNFGRLWSLAGRFGASF